MELWRASGPASARGHERFRRTSVASNSAAHDRQGAFPAGSPADCRYFTKAESLAETRTEGEWNAVVKSSRLAVLDRLCVDQAAGESAR